VPTSRRNTGNFLIDTMDMTSMYSPDAWNSIPAAERTAASTLPADKAFDTVLVNELQIELGLEEPYLARMSELAATIAKDRASIFMRYATDANLAGANDAAAYRALLTDLRKKPAAELKSTVDALNAFAVAQGSAIDPFTATSLKDLANADLTQEVRDRAVRKTRDVEENLAGARFVFQQYRDQLKSLAAVKASASSASSAMRAAPPAWSGRRSRSRRRPRAGADEGSRKDAAQHLSRTGCDVTGPARVRLDELSPHSSRSCTRLLRELIDARIPERLALRSRLMLPAEKPQV